MKSAKEKERELIISLHKKKKTVREIGELLGISKSKAAFWISRYKKTNDLKDRPRDGRPTPLTKETLNFIAEAIKSNLIKAKGKAGISSKEVLGIIKNKTHKKYTLRHTQRLLHKLGFSLITPRVSHIRKDKKAQEKFRAEFKKNLNRNIWTIP